MTGEYWVELENNHHYILVDGVHDRTYYCPAQDDANSIAHILNNQLKTIQKQREEIRALRNGTKTKPIFEIIRRFFDRDCHVAFVDSEEFAWEFCNRHKDCTYGQVPITKYLRQLDAMRANVPTCSNCKHFLDKHKVGQLCKLTEDVIEYDGYCSDWEYDE